MSKHIVEMIDLPSEAVIVAVVTMMLVGTVVFVGVVMFVFVVRKSADAEGTQTDDENGCEEGMSFHSFQCFVNSDGCSTLLIQY